MFTISQAMYLSGAAKVYYDNVVHAKSLSEHPVFMNVAKMEDEMGACLA